MFRSGFFFKICMKCQIEPSLSNFFRGAVTVHWLFKNLAANYTSTISTRFFVQYLRPKIWLSQAGDKSLECFLFGISCLSRISYIRGHSYIFQLLRCKANVETKMADNRETRERSYGRLFQINWSQMVSDTTNASIITLLSLYISLLVFFIPIWYIWPEFWLDFYCTALPFDRML